MSSDRPPAARLQAVLAFCDAWESYSPDTLHKYALLAKQLALKEKDSRALNTTDYYNAAYCLQKNHLDSALSLADQYMDWLTKHAPYGEDYVKAYILRANILLRSNHFTEILAKDLELLKMAEAHGDTIGMIRARISIGSVYHRLQHYDEALNWYKQALAYMQNPAYQKRFSQLYSNMAVTYYSLAKDDSCILYCKKAIAFSQEDGNMTNLANALLIYAGMMAHLNRVEEAEAAYQQGVDTRKKIGDIYYIITDLAQLSFFYYNAGKPARGIATAQEGLKLAESNGNAYPNIYSLYEMLGYNYWLAKDFKRYSETLEKLLTLKDSTYQANSNQALAEMQTRYDVQKKENTIIQQKYDLDRKNYFLLGSLGLLALTLLCGYVYFANRQKNQRLKLQAILLEQNRKTARAVLQAEEDERKRIAGELHDSVAQKMVVAKLNLEALEDFLPGEEKQSQKIYGNILSLVDDACTEVRALSHSMMPQAFFESGLVHAIRDFIDKADSSRLQVHFTATGEPGTIGKQKELMIYRIIQEAVQNVIKHAQATRLDIALLAEKDSISVTIEDNGTGFDATSLSSEGMGMKNIRSRIGFLNGEMDINTQVGRGTVLAFYIPAGTE